MGEELTANEMRVLRDVFERTRGQAWEPPQPDSRIVKRWIEAGYVRRCDMRCGFEAFKDTGLNWTEAGRAALSTLPKADQ